MRLTKGGQRYERIPFNFPFLVTIIVIAGQYLLLVCRQSDMTPSTLQPPPPTSSTDLQYSSASCCIVTAWLAGDFSWTSYLQFSLQTIFRFTLCWPLTYFCFLKRIAAYLEHDQLRKLLLGTGKCGDWRLQNVECRSMELERQSRYSQLAQVWRGPEI